MERSGYVIENKTKCAETSVPHHLFSPSLACGRRRGGQNEVLAIESCRSSVGSQVVMSVGVNIKNKS